MSVATYVRFRRVYEASASVSAEDCGCFEIPVQREWREEAGRFQAPLNKRETLLAIVRAARGLRRDDQELAWEEAIKLAAADVHAEAWEGEATARHNEEFEKSCAIAGRVEEVFRAVELALGTRFRVTACPRFGSQYGIYSSRIGSLKLRVSDHAQVAGGGWNEERQERNGEADLQWVVGLDTPIPSREQIRGDVLAQIKERR